MQRKYVQKCSAVGQRAKNQPNRAQIALAEPERSCGRSEADEINVVRLRTLLSLFDISQQAVARVTGLSKAYVSSVLNGTGEGIYPYKLFSLLEAALAELLRHRRKAFFSLETVEQAQVDEAVEQLRRHVA